MKRFCILVLLTFLCGSAWALELTPDVRAGLDLMNNGRLLEAYTYLKETHAKNAADVQATFGLALVKFRIMWLSTYDQSDRKELVGLLDDVEAKTRNHLDNKDMMFYYSAICGIRAQLVATEGDWWEAAKLGKSMKKNTEKLVKMDSDYYPAYYLLGTYNYFADVLPGAVKFLRSLLFIPGGDRNEGLRQLSLAYEKDNAVSVEAGRTMVLIQVYYEKAYPTGVRVADNLLTTYPDNFEVGIYKGVGLYYNQSWDKCDEWLHHLRDELLAYSREHKDLPQHDGVVPLYVPMERESRYWIARSLIQRRRYAEARELLAALASAPVDQPYWLKRWVYLSLAQLDYLDGRSESAERWLDPVLRDMDVKNSHDKAEIMKKKKGRVGMFETDFQ
jgi:hypothetical protein